MASVCPYCPAKAECQEDYNVALVPRHTAFLNVLQLTKMSFSCDLIMQSTLWIVQTNKNYACKKNVLEKILRASHRTDWAWDCLMLNFMTAALTTLSCRIKMLCKKELTQLPVFSAPWQFKAADLETTNSNKQFSKCVKEVVKTKSVIIFFFFFLNNHLHQFDINSSGLINAEQHQKSSAFSFAVQFTRSQ